MTLNLLGSCSGRGMTLKSLGSWSSGGKTRCPRRLALFLSVTIPPFCRALLILKRIWSKRLTSYPEKNPLVSHTRKMPPGLVGSTTTPSSLQLCLAPLFIDSYSVLWGSSARAIKLDVLRVVAFGLLHTGD